MAQRSKAYKAAKAAIGDDLYSPAEAIRLAKETNPSKTDATVEVALRLSVDPRKADQMVRGSVSLPHGTGKTARVIVFASGAQAEAALAAGADEVGVQPCGRGVDLALQGPRSTVALVDLGLLVLDLLDELGPGLGAGPVTIAKGGRFHFW